MNIKKDFPLLISRQNEPFIYLDNAATTHKPKSVIEAITHFYAHDYATVGRSMYALAEKATEAVETIRKSSAHFIDAQPEEIVFTKGATEGINLVAASWVAQYLKPGDRIVISEQEHHANLLPWLELAKEFKAHIAYIPITPEGELVLKNLDIIITPQTKFVALASISNALGIKNEIKPIIERAHAVGAKVLLDVSQSIAHEKISVKKLNPDFLVFSGHKMLGPTGIGILYIKKSLLASMKPYHYGGGMVYEADYDAAEYRQGPEKFEAGTLPIAQIIGLGAAIEYFNAHINFAALKLHEEKLMKQLIQGLEKMPAITILGPKAKIAEGSILSFTVKGFHPHDIAAFLDQKGIAIRAGHYCAQPLAKKLGIPGSIRVSIFGYNTPEDIEALLKALEDLNA